MKTIAFQRVKGWSAKNVWLLAIVFVGLVLRLIWYSYVDTFPYADFEEYRLLAENLLKHFQFGYPEYTAYRLPLYPVFLAIAMLFSGSIAWLSFLSVVLSSLTAFLVGILAYRLSYSKLISILAVLFTSFHPVFIMYSTVLASEHLFLLLLLCALILIYEKNFSQSVFKQFLAGIVYGLTMLTRGEGMFYLPVFLLLILINGGDKKKILSRLVVVVLAMIITVGPWYIRNQIVVGAGSGLSTTTGLNFYYAHNSHQYGWHERNSRSEFLGINNMAVNKNGLKAGMDYIKKTSINKLLSDVRNATYLLYLWPGDYSLRCSTLANKASKIVSNDSLMSLLMKSVRFYYLLLVFSAAALLFLIRYPLKTTVLLLGIIFMNWLGYAVIFWGMARYRYTAELLFCLLSAVFISEIIFLAQKVYIKINQTKYFSLVQISQNKSTQFLPDKSFLIANKGNKY